MTVSNYRKSSYSGQEAAGGCVECGNGDRTIAIRDTTDRDGVTLSVSAGAWMTFLSALR
jgi:hypothetical protein